MKKRYDDIIHLIVTEIQSGGWPSGSRIPSQIQIARKLNCSRSSVERAFRELTREGWLTASRGGGTCASIPKSAAKVTNLLAVVDSGDMLTRDSFSSIFLNLDTAGLPCRWVTAEFALGHLHQLLKHDTAVISYLPDVPQHLLLEELKEDHVPLLVLNRDYDGFDRVTTDTKAGITEGLDWLQEKGMEEFALVSNALLLEKPYLPERLLACYELCMEKGIPLEKECLLKLDSCSAKEKMEEQIAELLSRQRGIRTGIFATNYALAASVLSAAEKDRMKAGKDFLMFTFDHIPDRKPSSGTAVLKQQYHRFRSETEQWIRRLNTGKNTPFIKRIPPLFKTETNA